jgi:hypothetical protein
MGAGDHLPFRTVKNTGHVPREGGWEAYDVDSETTVCCADDSGELQRAQIDIDGRAGGGVIPPGARRVGREPDPRGPASRREEEPWGGLQTPASPYGAAAGSAVG